MLTTRTLSFWQAQHWLAPCDVAIAANGTLFVAVAGASDDQSVPPTAEVFDQLGRKVLRAAISPTADGIYSLDLGAVKPGAYLLRWQDVPTPLRFIKTTAQ